VSIELIEYSVFLYFLEAMIWESCIIVGMVPVNTHYQDVFDRSTVAMQIIDEDGRTCTKSVAAPTVSEELFSGLKRQAPVRTPEGQEFNLHVIRGGYAIWVNDISKTLKVIDELQKIAERLEHDGELLRQELKTRSDEASVREQSRIYNQLTEEIGGQLSLLIDLLKNQEEEADKDKLFRKICLIGTYIKRRSNLRLVQQTDGRTPGKDLELCYRELAGTLQQMGVEAEVLWSEAVTFSTEFAVFALDVFEFLLEHESFNLHSVIVNLEADNSISIQIQSGGGSSGLMTAGELQQICKDEYKLSLQVSGNGYQVLVSNGGG